MAGVVFTHPANLADGATITETYVDNVTNGLIAIDGVLARRYPLQSNNTIATVSNSTTNLSVFNYTIPANTLGSGGVTIGFDAFCGYKSNTGSTENIYAELVYGTTQCFGSATALNFKPVTGQNTYSPLFLTGFIAGNGDTSTQIAGCSRVSSGWNNNFINLGGAIGSAAEDSTGALTFSLELKNGATDANLGVAFYHSIVWYSA